MRVRNFLSFMISALPGPAFDWWRPITHHPRRHKNMSYCKRPYSKTFIFSLTIFEYSCSFFIPALFYVWPLRPITTPTAATATITLRNLLPPLQTFDAVQEDIATTARLSRRRCEVRNS